MLDVGGLSPSERKLIIRGLCGFLILAVLASALLARYSGTWRNTTDITALMASVGDGLPPNADVKFQGVLVGTVAGVTHADDADVKQVELRLHPERAVTIPDSVTARVVPSNVFAVSSIELVANGPAAPLRSGAIIYADESSETLELQTAMTTLRDVFSSIQPSQLNAMLAEISAALDGRGERIGDTMTMLGAYLREIRGEIPDFSADLAMLQTTLDSLNRSSPRLVDAFSDWVDPSQTLIDKRAELTGLLLSGDAALRGLTGALAPNLDGGIRLVRDFDPVLGAIAANPSDVRGSIEAVGATARGFRDAFTSPNGRLTMSANISLTPFTPYSASQCPRYGNMVGRSCFTAPATADPGQLPQQLELPAAPGPTADVVASTLDTGGNVAGNGSPEEVEILRQILGRDATPADVALLAPVLRGNTVAVEGGER